MTLIRNSLAPCSRNDSSLMVTKDGRYLVLVVGPFANLSDDFMVLCDFLGRVRALRTISNWNVSPKHALATNRHILVSRFGHLASLMWARLILGRFRDAVLPDLHSPSSSGAFFDVFSSDPRRVDMSKGLRLFAASVFFSLAYSRLLKVGTP